MLTNDVVSFEQLGPGCKSYLKRVLLKPASGRGLGQCCNITLLHMNRSNKTESAIFVSLVCSLLSEDFHSELIVKVLAM